MSAPLVLRIAGDGTHFTCHTRDPNGTLSPSLARAGEAHRLAPVFRETVRAWLARSRGGRVPARELAGLLRRSAVSKFLQGVEIRGAPNDQRLRPGPPRTVSAELRETATGYAILPLVPANKNQDQYEVIPAGAAVFWGHSRRSSYKTEEIYALNWPPELEAVRTAFLRELRLADVLASRERWLQAGVEGLDYGDLLPEPHTIGPLYLLSLEPLASSRRLQLLARLQFAYTGAADSEEVAVFPLSPARDFYESDEHGRLARRSPEAEGRLLKGDLPLPVRLPSGEYRPAAGRTAEFLDRLPELEATGVRVRLHRDLAGLRPGGESRYRPGLRFESTVTKHGAVSAWLEGHLRITGLSAEDRAAVMAAIRERREFARLTNGEWLRVNDASLQRLRAALREIDRKLDEKIGRMLPAEVARLGAALDAADLELPKQSRIPDLIARLRSDDVPARAGRRRPKPRGFRGKLRPYQKDGLGFLLDLYECGAGGILADDMGLGKTIQGLAFLAELYARETKSKFLVVGPPAALGVWRSAAEQFVPDLPLHVHHGPERRQAQKTRGGGIILTTFTTLSRDLTESAESSSPLTQPFAAVLVDEAQHVRNHRSKSARALRQVRARSIIALTGTPIENDLAELWSLFDLVLPGLLEKRAAYLRRYRRDDADLGDLRARIRPFLLRRHRGDVLKELPPLSEAGIVIALEKRQRVLYENARRAAVREVRRMNNDGSDYVAKILPQLMRLRRLACHPQLDRGRAADPALSGKFLHLTNMLTELRNSAAGILIFSQFTDALDIAETLLKSLGLEFARIDGQTPARRREKIVREFQAGRYFVLLISLKAGGTAFTLHRADTVIHLDPWWNPAAERQATDRVHRMGQQRPVFVYRLIAEHTIEEKVLELQRRKRVLFDRMFAAGEGDGAGGVPKKAEMLRLLEDSEDRTT